MKCTVESLIAECQRLEKDCLYTSQCHYELAERYDTRMKRFIVIPAALAAGLALTATISSAATPLGYMATISGAVAATAASLGMEKAVSSHRLAANLMTALRHQVHRLYSVYYRELTIDEFSAQVKSLCERYEAYVVALEITDKKAFDEASNRIDAGVFDYGE